MRMRRSAIAMLLWIVPATALAQNGSPPPGPTVKAAPLSGKIELDGRLTEAGWQSVTPATDFRQMDPHEGQPSSQRTEVRFLFDDEALYIGARMYDSLGVAGVRPRLSRRDQIEGDNIQIIFDTFHDHTGRTIFMVGPSGTKFDAGQAAPFADPSWDPIWDVATSIDSLGWTAELKIPLSQLRFKAGAEQTWGLQIWRFVERLNEVTMWSFWGKQENGGPARFGHLEGLQLESRRLGVELLPYVVTRAESITPAQPGTPLRDPNEYALRAGADIKALLTSTLTLDATINPDFGQVEVDPAVVNLSAFETFFSEKRPFFVEGSGLFGFGGFSCYFCSNVSSLDLFYSRRIGRRPQGFVSGNPRFVEMPENSTILGAAKITGRTANGYQIGLMNALTSAEKARAVMTTGSPFEQEVEPLSNYFVGRVKRNFNNGNSTMGAIATSVIRGFENDALRDLMPTHAEALGTDVNFWFKNRTYNFMANAAISQVSGAEAALHRLQLSSARYFARPDREHGSNGLFTDKYDPGLTTMRGAGAYARFAKNAGTWLWETAVNLRTPGFEVNDLAFLTRADYIWLNANILRQWTKPTSLYRNASITLGAQQQFNFDGDRNDLQFHNGWNMQLANYWFISGFAIVRPEVLDDRLTRGGAVVRRARVSSLFANANTDSRKRVSLGLNGGYNTTAEGAVSANAGIFARIKPATNIVASIGPSYSHSESTAQFVRTFADPAATHFYGQRVVFADLTQHSLSMDTRVSATFTPTLTLELFAQPFVSSGDYSAFKEYVAPRKLEKRVFDGSQLRTTQQNGRTVYQLDPDRNAATANFSFNNPDFNFRSLRGNAVLRWEYRPGSTVYVVWQQSRSDSELYGDFDLGRDTGAIFRGKPDNIFLVKFNYWVGK